jgi:HSP20 family protein
MNDRMTQQPTGDGTTDGTTQDNQNRSLSRQTQQHGMTNQQQEDTSPFALMRRFSEDVDRMFSAFGFGTFGNFGSMNRQLDRTGRSRGMLGTSSGMSTISPSVNVFTRGDDLVVSADLPGIKPEDVHVDIEGNNLIIQGETSTRNDNKGDRGYWYSESSYGSFYRSIPLPPGTPSEQATAQYNNGVLEVTLPGAARSVQQPRRIPIQGASTQPQTANPNTQTNQATNTSENRSSSTATSSSQQQEHTHQ